MKSFANTGFSKDFGTRNSKDFADLVPKSGLLCYFAQMKQVIEKSIYVCDIIFLYKATTLKFKEVL